MNNYPYPRGPQHFVWPTEKKTLGQKIAGARTKFSAMNAWYCHLTPAHRALLIPLIVLPLLILGSVAGSVNKIPKEDEAAIRSVFPAANYIVLYHDQGNVPQPRGVDWSEAREYSVKSKMDELNWGRWHVVVLRGRIVNVEWVND
jgi:hypothetical protein